MPAKAPVEALKPFLLDVPHARIPPIERDGILVPGLYADPLPQPYDWHKLFGNPHPVEIEIGFGKGLFLQNESQARPDTNFVGVEIERKYVYHTANRLLHRGVKNVRLACTDGKWFLQMRVAPSSVAGVHVYFPDPWWKKKHKKRKLFTTEFAEAVLHALMPGGRLFFVSDVLDYFNDTLSLLQPMTAFCPVGTPEVSDPLNENDYLTNFERKFRKEGRPIYRAWFEKR